VRLRLTPTCATHVSLSPFFAKGAAAKRRGDFSSAAGCRSCTSYASPFTSLPLNTSRIEGASGLGCISPLLSRAMYSLYRSEEHTSELQSRENLVCRLLLEK